MDSFLLTFFSFPQDTKHFNVFELDSIHIIGIYNTKIQAVCWLVWVWMERMLIPDLWYVKNPNQEISYRNKQPWFFLWGYSFHAISLFRTKEFGSFCLQLTKSSQDTLKVSNWRWQPMYPHIVLLPIQIFFFLFFTSLSFSYYHWL